MQRQRFLLADDQDIHRILSWADGYPCAAYLCPNGYSYPQNPFQHVLSVGVKPFSFDRGHVFQGLSQKQTGTWWFGYLGYELKHELEEMETITRNGLGLPDVFFFEASVLLFLDDNAVTIEAGDPQRIWAEIRACDPVVPGPVSKAGFTSTDSFHSYVEKVATIRNWIAEGRIYEVNLCQFFESDLKINGLQVFFQLQKRSPMPFSAWMKGPGFEVVSASPERFLKKDGRRLVSQPIKGTSPRFKDPADDEKSKDDLLNSEKERAENLMIVDLVRNDLARVSTIGSTGVDELFGIYSFPKVHQMISTVSSELRENQTWMDAIRSAFPMGSMTGAPKLEAMKVIDELERYHRGAFSGALGYITPDHDFDFNVLIRSLFINHTTGKAGFAAGSAITWDSMAENEWDECAAKASALLGLFGTDWQSIKRPD